MMISLDTNYLVRFLTNDIKTQAAAAAKIIQKAKEVYISSVTAAETAFVLRYHYKIDKISVCNQLQSLLGQVNIKVHNFVINALKVYEIENISFYDCLILTECIERNMSLKTFDKKLEKVYKKYSQN